MCSLTLSLTSTPEMGSLSPAPSPFYSGAVKIIVKILQSALEISMEIEVELDRNSFILHTWDAWLPHDTQRRQYFLLVRQRKLS